MVSAREMETNGGKKGGREVPRLYVSRDPLLRNTDTHLPSANLS